jgi:hypothetical protein
MRRDVGTGVPPDCDPAGDDLRAQPPVSHKIAADVPGCERSRLAAIQPVLAHSDTRPQEPGQPAGDGLQIFGLNQISRDRGRDQPGQYVRFPPDCIDYIPV